MQHVTPIDYVGNNVVIQHKDHTATVPLADVKHPVLQFGGENKAALSIVCPVCGAQSLWPVGGGADAEIGQELHLRARVKQGKSLPEAIAEMETLITERREPPDRFRFKDVKDLAEVRDRAKNAKKARPL